MFISFLNAPGGQYRSVGCMDGVKAYEYSDPGSAGCITGAAFYLYFSLAMVYWLTFISIDLCLGIFMTKFQDEHRYIFYSIYSWGLPLISTVCSLGLYDLGGTGILPFCFYQPNAPVRDSWIFFYFPEFIHFVVILLSLSFVLFQVIKSSREAHSNKSNKTLSLNIRLIMLILVTLFCVGNQLVIVTLNYFNITESASFTADFGTWVSCILLGGSQASCGLTPRMPMPLSSVYISMFDAAGIGFLFFLVYGTRIADYRRWYGLFTGQGTQYTKNSSTGVGSTGIGSSHQERKRVGSLIINKDPNSSGNQKSGTLGITGTTGSTQRDSRSTMPLPHTTRHMRTSSNSTGIQKLNLVLQPASPSLLPNASPSRINDNENENNAEVKENETNNTNNNVNNTGTNAVLSEVELDERHVTVHI